MDTAAQDVDRLWQDVQVLCEKFTKAHPEADLPTKESKEDFNDILTAMHFITMVHHFHCDHPVVGELYLHFDDVAMCLINIDLRAMVMTMVQKTKAEAVKAMNEQVPKDMNDRFQATFAAMFVVQPDVVTIDDIIKAGIPLSKIVSHINTKINEWLFEGMASEATQPGAAC